MRQEQLDLLRGVPEVAFVDDLKGDVARILAGVWTVREGRTVPDTPDLKLGNDAVTLGATVLYADLTASTALVDTYLPAFAAEMYKIYLHVAAKIIRSEAGAITAYDGDRVMAVFIGDSKNTSAARAALKIHYAVLHIINPAIKSQYAEATYVMRQTVGIDTSNLFVARSGVRGANDLVWVGRAANYAAKLCAMSDDFSTWITSAVYDQLNEELKITKGQSMWEPMTWTAVGSQRIYRSSWWWRI